MLIFHILSPDELVIWIIVMKSLSVEFLGFFISTVNVHLIALAKLTVSFIALKGNV